MKPRRARLQEVKPHIGGVACERRLAKGHPSETILRLAEKEEADLVVMGLHGETNAPQALMGAVAEPLSNGRRVPCC